MNFFIQIKNDLDHEYCCIKSKCQNIERATKPGQMCNYNGDQNYDIIICYIYDIIIVYYYNSKS